MLLSTLQERERRFKIALRAGIPALMFIGVILYIVFAKDVNINISIRESLIMAGIVFTTIYFIYFMLELATKGTLVDNETDGFTPNAFIEAVRKYKPNTMSILAIKNLNIINNNYGTKATNKLLQNLIQSLDIFLEQHNLSNVIIGRYNSSEFLLALDRDSQDVEDILTNFIQNYREIQKIELDYHFSILINNDDNIERSITRLHNSIDRDNCSINKAKSKKMILKDSKKEKELEEAITSALTQDSVIFTFRPLQNTKTNNIDIYTISVKLKTTMGEILPRTYLPIINRLGFGQIYDMLIVKQIVKTISQIDDNVSLSFNLSPYSIRDKTFLQKTLDIIELANIEPSRFIIEIYERNTYHNLNSYLNTLNDIRSTGIRICIDNFGTSNSSLDYIKYFKFDMVQFDRDFTTNIDDSNNLILLNSFIKMGKKLDIITIAKWVDKDEQKDKLTKLGINYLQGFGISKPINTNQLITTHTQGK